MNSYKILIDKYKDQNKYIFVVGAGPSLYQISRLQEFQKEIFKHPVISVNSSILVMPWYDGKPDDRYWISNDALVMRWTYWPKVQKSKCIKIVRNSWEKYHDTVKNFLIFNPRKTSENIINPDDIGLAYCSSIPSGVDLAIQMSCRMIFLLGVDHYMDKFRSHFWQYWHMRNQPKGPLSPQQQQKSSFGFSVQTYNALKKFAKSRGIKIYNCSKDSKLDVFKKIDFMKAFDIIGQ